VINSERNVVAISNLDNIGLRTVFYDNGTWINARQGTPVHDSIVLGVAVERLGNALAQQCDAIISAIIKQHQ
jgi:hypothetical protein